MYAAGRGRGRKPPLAERRGEHKERRGEHKGWAHQDSNLERPRYERVALTIELWALDRAELVARRRTRMLADFLRWTRFGGTRAPSG